MGRIFEVRKHTMFARWNRMAKQFARIAKDITMAVKSGGTDPDFEPDAAPRDPERARRQHAEGQGRGRDQARLRPGRGELPGGDLRGLRAARRRRCSSRPPPTTPRAPSPACATSSPRAAATSATSGSVSFLFKKMGVFRLNPEGIDQDDLELYLIDHGLEEMGESTGEKGEPQIVIRCAFADFGNLQEALEARGITPLSAEHEYICTVRPSCPKSRPRKCSTLIDKLEQDDDVQKVFHTLA